MKTFYQITTKEIGVIMLRRRKIAKAFRWWLRENGFDCKSTHCINDSGKPIPCGKVFAEKNPTSYRHQQATQAENHNDNNLLIHQDFSS
jgi:hypothetical protein